MIGIWEGRALAVALPSHRISEFFALPIEAIFSRKPFRPLSEEIYQQNHL